MVSTKTVIALIAAVMIVAALVLYGRRLNRMLNTKEKTRWQKQSPYTANRADYSAAGLRSFFREGALFLRSGILRKIRRLWMTLNGWAR
jgi:hypothetical protein